MVLALICCCTMQAQTETILPLEQTDTIAVLNTIRHADVLRPFYQKIQELQQGSRSKINIVHIGDSHIQADLLTNATRQELQKTFGNGGRGFVFPYSLAKTNGSSDVRFKSDVQWESLRNIYPANGIDVGLSGIGLETSATDFSIELKLREPSAYFNTIRIITPGNSNSFAVSTDRISVVSETEVPKPIIHHIKRGDVLSTIAARYNTSVTEIKRHNNLRTNAIQAGKTLKIPTSATEKRRIEKFEFVPLPMLSDSVTHYYHSNQPLDKITIVPLANAGTNLNGIILETDSPGILYHGIGVNGAKFSDYNKYPLFFDQMKALQPDLVIVSLGTNESFDKVDGAEFENQMSLFLQNIHNRFPGMPILVTTPPPSLFNRKSKNTFIDDYVRRINATADARFAIYDLYARLGGHDGISENLSKGLLGSDRVHYTKEGYQLQGRLLAEAILNGFPQN